jgi:hypothetical protein
MLSEVNLLCISHNTAWQGHYAHGGTEQQDSMARPIMPKP